jgi:hypothetical protein
MMKEIVTDLQIIDRENEVLITTITITPRGKGIDNTLYCSDIRKHYRYALAHILSVTSALEIGAATALLRGQLHGLCVDVGENVMGGE